MSDKSNLRAFTDYESIQDWYRNTILKRRDAFREAFANWDVTVVAGFRNSKVVELVSNKNIIRNKLKIQATIDNAKTIISIQSEHHSFCHWFYNVIEGTEYPAIQKELRKTFKFMGPEISRMWLMASGRITKYEGDKYRPEI